ncbi:ras-related protein Rab-11A-like [Diaphorina citri]|uniref:Ras-related protein Rab-11A-like n=1 Tax=Diaphorina citri TaxID=121845 RepID=A0A3Q0JB66_DIACI|nr:ras-related protein Rab-11A-like [Diaphorina citri]
MPTFAAKHSFSAAKSTEIYKIVSQKQMRDPPEGDTIRPHNVETIDVKPTVHNDSMRKQCCQTS